jgi:hypothetical protein
VSNIVVVSSSNMTSDIHPQKKNTIHHTSMAIPLHPKPKPNPSSLTKPILRPNALYYILPFPTSDIQAIPIIPIKNQANKEEGNKKQENANPHSRCFPAAKVSL